jgi:hypothetical protein
LLPCLDLSRRIETEEHDDQNEYDRSYAHGFLRHPANDGRREEADENTDEWT